MRMSAKAEYATRAMVQMAAAEPGTVIASDGQQLVIATGEGTLAIDSLQPAGKRVLQISEFLRGYPVKAGEKFGG